MTRESQTALKLTLAQASLLILVAAFTAPPANTYSFLDYFQELIDPVIHS